MAPSYGLPGDGDSIPGLAAPSQQRRGAERVPAPKGHPFSPSPSSSSSTKLEESLLSRVQAYLRSYIYTPEEGRLGAVLQLGKQAARPIPGESKCFSWLHPRSICAAAAAARRTCDTSASRRLLRFGVGRWIPPPREHGWAEAVLILQPRWLVRE